LYYEEGLIRKAGNIADTFIWILFGLIHG